MKKKDNEYYEDYVLIPRILGLNEYYKNNKELTIIGLNDSQGVNTTNLLKKGLLEFIAEELKDEEIKTTVIDAFSLMFNKTEHINYLLRSNPNLEEIRDLQVYGMVSALEKAMGDFYLPKCLGKVGYVSRMLHKQRDENKNIRLTDTLRDSKEPIVIYSSGANDIMREGWNNPLSIARDYKKQNSAYKYAVDKLSDISTVKRVINRVDENFNNILSINDEADIFALGLYIPKSMQRDGMEIFNDAIQRYNNFLMELCKKYNIEYIDTQLTARKNNNSDLNFHITTEGHNTLENKIIERLYDRKLYRKSKANITEFNDFKIGKHGLYEMLVDLKRDYQDAMRDCNFTMDKNEREYQIAIQKGKEIERQIGVVQKTLTKRK